MVHSNDTSSKLADGCNETLLLERLRHGDESAFDHLLNQHHAPMLRIALIYLRDRDLAEEVVQETWVAVLRGLDRFEGRSSLKTWIFTILTNRAKTRALREGRSAPLSEVLDSEETLYDATVEPERFTHPRYPGHWRMPPDSWDNIPESHFLSQETATVIQQAIDRLPIRQRAVMTLRDVEGWTADEVCNFLAISETNQRVLLHRARACVRRALEGYFEKKD